MTTKIRIEKVRGVNPVSIDILGADGKVADTKTLLNDGESFNTEVHPTQSFAVREVRQTPEANEAGPGADRGGSEAGEDKATA